MLVPADVILLLVPLLLIGIIVWQFWRRPITREPRCGHCGYIVRGISSLSCPECGSDLREAGIFPPGVRLPMDARRRAVIWTAALPILAVPLSVVLQYAIGPAVYQRRMHCNLPYGYDLLKGIPVVELLGRKIYWGMHWQSPAVPVQTLRLSRGYTVGGGGPLTVDLASRRYTFVDAKGDVVRSADGFGVQTIVDWLAAQGVDPASKATADLADKIMIDIADMQRVKGSFQRVIAPPSNLPGAGVTRFGTTVNVYPQTLWWNIALWAGLWLLVWLAGIRRIRHRVGAATARAHEAHEIPPAE